MKLDGLRGSGFMPLFCVRRRVACGGVNAPLHGNAAVYKVVAHEL